MKLENVFEVKAPIDEVWTYMLDVERVAPCMPGAELTEVVDENTYKGKTNVKVGPVSLSFAGTVVKQEQDEAAHRVVLKADGREQRGKGAASALVVSQLEAVEGGTRVSIDADLTITGAVAQYGRGMIGDISQRLTREFAQCLEAGILAAAAERASGSTTGEAAAQDIPVPGTEAAAAPRAASAAPPAPRVAARPVKGFRLGLWAFWRAVVRFFRRLFRPREA